MESHLNPYASPTTSCTNVMETRPSSGSPLLAAASAVYFLAFLVFTIMLLRSSPIDRKAGMLFLANVPVLAGLVFSLARSSRLGMWLGLVAALVQLMILLGMLLKEIGDAPLVIGINGIVMTPALLLGWLAKRRGASDTFFQTQHSFLQ